MDTRNIFPNSLKNNILFQLVGKGSDITEASVKAFLASVKQSIIDVEAQEIIKVLDKNGDGKVCIEDFKDIWTKK